MHTKWFHFSYLAAVLCVSLATTANAEMVGWWRFDEGSGTVTRDWSRYKNDVVLKGGPQWVVGHSNGGLQFDGTDDYLDRGTHEHSLDIVGAVTLTAWVRPGATARDHEICGNVTIGANGGGYTMGIYSNNNLELEVRSSAGTSGQPNRPGGGTALQANTWYFLAATYSQTADGGVIRTYINGLFDREEVTTIVMAPSTGTFKIGRDASAPGSAQFIGVLDDVRVYNHVLTEAELQEAMAGKWPQSKIAFAPRPEDGQVDVPRDVVLGWMPGIYAQKHDVYFGSTFEDVLNANRNNRLNVLLGQNQDANTYDPGILDFGRTYFWRIDEVNAPPAPTIYTGDVWTFTTEPFAYAIPADKITATASSSEDTAAGPGKTSDGSGLVNDLHSTDTKAMWVSKNGDPGPAQIRYDFDKSYELHQIQVWNYNGPSILTGFGFRAVTIEYSTNGATWTVLPNVADFARAPGKSSYACNTTVNFDGITAQSVRITANSNWGGALFKQYGLSEVRFLYLPLRARYPSPGSGTTDVAVDATLSWRAGREAATHDVYLGTDQQAVTSSSIPTATLTRASYGPLSLDLGTTYYWMVNEVNSVETPAVLEGDIWNFSTQEYLVVDDFEDYNDYPPHEIYTTWLDGFDSVANGSQVGNLTPPLAETVTIHGGKQSMPLFYSNTTGATYSEAERTFAVSQDWTKHGITTLVLYFYGTPGNTGQLYAKINGVKVLYADNAADVAKPVWKQWNIDLVSLGIALQSVTKLAIGVDGNGAVGTLYVDDILLYRIAPAVATEELWIEAESGSITAPLRVFSSIPGASGGQYIEVEASNNSTTDPPAAGGVASYTISVKAGVYRINCRVIAPSTSNDSLWVRIQGATTQTKNHASGWVRWNDIAGGTDWHWDAVHSSDDSNKEVEWTMAAGTYTLNVAYREEGVLLDALMITKLR